MSVWVLCLLYFISILKISFIWQRQVQSPGRYGQLVCTPRIVMSMDRFAAS